MRGPEGILLFIAEYDPKQGRHAVNHALLTDPKHLFELPLFRSYKRGQLVSNPLSIKVDENGMYVEKDMGPIMKAGDLLYQKLDELSMREYRLPKRKF